MLWYFHSETVERVPQRRIGGNNEATWQFGGGLRPTARGNDAAPWGKVSVYVGAGPERTVMDSAWDDDAKISRIVHELNFGKYAKEAA